MDFNDTADEAEYRARARDWLAANVAAHKAIDHGDDMAAARAWQARKAAAGYAQITSLAATRAVAAASGSSAAPLPSAQAP